MRSDPTLARSHDPGAVIGQPLSWGESGSNATQPWKPLWQKWSRFLRRMGMDELAASLLESAGALNILNSQLIYLTQPVLGLIVSDEDLRVLAQTLEEPERVTEFVSTIREEGSL